jgi:hypothetical protein
LSESITFNKTLANSSMRSGLSFLAAYNLNPRIIYFLIDVKSVNLLLLF